MWQRVVNNTIIIKVVNNNNYNSNNNKRLSFHVGEKCLYALAIKAEIQSQENLEIAVFG